MIAEMSTHVRKKDRMYYFLTNVHQFQVRTLDLLAYKNLKRLALDYGFVDVERV